MVLTIDIGNTNIVLGGWNQDKLEFVSRLETNRFKTEDGYAIELKSIFELYQIERSGVEGSIISSVVPQISGAVAHSVERLTGKKPLVVGPGIKTGLNIRVDDPAHLGSDLVVDAVAALAKYPKPIIIVDMGTATKISAIDTSGSFMGCAIIPGIRLGLDALAERTAQLPHIELKTPEEMIGKNSSDSMQSGAVYGTASMIDGMVERFEQRLNQKASVVATGGFAGDIIPHCRRKITLCPHLLMEGLLMIYRKNVAAKI
ncbi:MAG TPA: type III pantothenate kinase [Clostridia bacterium]|nr:type III pantothenate kinase [Clostridia bacterium]